MAIWGKINNNAIRAGNYIQKIDVVIFSTNLDDAWLSF